MNLLKEGIEKKGVYKLETTKKLTIAEHSEVYPIYKIRLDYLFYNDKNDRIATYVSNYKIKNNTQNMDLSNKEEYNKIMHNFITESNKEALIKTQNNIAAIGQDEAGVVLSDGRIIDGNRRFTCLRNIQEETGKIQYFEAVILDHKLENNEKEIKALELRLQHGVDQKVNYNPIDKLVGIYNDIIDKKMFTIEEYAKYINEKPSQVTIEVEKAHLMVEFLEFINSPKQFHRAREFNLGASLKELNSMLKKVKDEEGRENLKNCIFCQLLVQPAKDTTRYLYKIQNIANDQKFLYNYVDELLETVEKVTDIICENSENNELSTEAIAKIRDNDDIKRDLFKTTDKYVEKLSATKTRNEPTKLVKDACNKVEIINTDIFKKFNKNEKQEFELNLQKLQDLINEIKGELNE